MWNYKHPVMVATIRASPIEVLIKTYFFVLFFATSCPTHQIKTYKKLRNGSSYKNFFLGPMFFQHQIFNLNTSHTHKYRTNKMSSHTKLKVRIKVIVQEPKEYENLIRTLHNRSSYNPLYFFLIKSLHWRCSKLPYFVSLLKIKFPF